MIKRAHVALMGGALLGLLSGCELFPHSQVPQARPDHLMVPAAHVSAQSMALAKYYAKVQQSFLAQGLLRTDGGGPDVPFDARDLVRDFLRIAMYEEYTTASGRILAQETPSTLHKWTEPVRLEIRFGASVPLAQRVRDRKYIGTYAKRLSRLTHHPVRVVDHGGNFFVFVVNEDERRALAGPITAIIPEIDKPTLNAVIDMPRSTFCIVFALDAGDTGTYSKALAVIRSEHPDLMRKACIHEELAQGLGLPNDSPRARPSIFNDDEEFGLLTTHDELLLRMLYDPRMTPGMNLNAARKQAEIIANELLGTQS